MLYSFFLNFFKSYYNFDALRVELGQSAVVETVDAIQGLSYPS